MRSSLIVVCLLGACSGNGLDSQNGDGGGGGDLAMSSGNDLSMSGSQDLAAGGMCDLIKEDCPPGDKCVVVNMMMMTTTQCVMTVGSVADGQPCMRGMGGAPDDCAAGLACTTRGASAMSPVCRKYCAADGDCDQGQKCSLLSTRLTNVGVCIPACQPFGSDCGSLTCATTAQAIGSTMQNPKIFWTCRAAGATPAFGQCQRSSDCAADLVCDQSGTCVPLCDDSHACPNNPDAYAGGTLTCQPLGTGPANPGVCQ